MNCVYQSIIELYMQRNTNQKQIKINTSYKLRVYYNIPTAYCEL